MAQSLVEGSVNGHMHLFMEYDLAFEPSKTLKGQGLVDFIVEHSIDLDDVNYINYSPWKL